MSQKIYFVSGVNGVGKSTLIPHLRALLSADQYVVHDFDARGVPDGADHAWRKTRPGYGWRKLLSLRLKVRAQLCAVS